MLCLHYELFYTQATREKLNVLQLEQGESHKAGVEVQQGGLKRWRILRTMFTRDPNLIYVSLKFQTGMTFLFRLHENFTASSLWNSYVLLWDKSFVGKRDYKVVIKKKYFVKIFQKFKQHLLFGCFGVCIYCIDNVSNAVFYLNSQLSTCLLAYFVTGMCHNVSLQVSDVYVKKARRSEISL